MVNKIEDIGLDTIPACDRRTDILLRHIGAMYTDYASRSKNPEVQKICC